jgi:hypothetical protein
MPADRSDAACTVIIMTGTSGRAALAFGKSSRPVIPGMLMSERIRINDAPAASLV